MNSALRERIYQKYIHPIERTPQPYVGAEFEYPVINWDKLPVSIPALQETVKAFSAKFHFTEQKADADGNLYSLTNPENGDNLSFDCSFNTLELSFGREASIHVLNQRFHDYFTFLKKELSKHRHTITGMGVNPYYQYNNYQPIQNDRYRMLYKYLHSYKEYDSKTRHDIPEFSMLAAASQVQLDTSKEQVLLSLNTFNLLEPFKAVLFANSYFDKLPDLIISRDYLWKYSSQGINTHNLDMYDVHFRTIDEYIDYVLTQSMYCVGKDGKYLHFKPIPLTKYFSSEQVTGTYFDDGEWKQYTFHPELDDLEHLRTFKFSDLTYRGTIEFRSACEQPISDTFTHSAFHAGLSQKLDELSELLENDTVLYQHGYNAAELRELFTHREYPDFADRKALSGKLIEILNLAESGLKERGLQEESFLQPLYERAERLTNPALDFWNGIQSGDSLTSWIEHYSE